MKFSGKQSIPNRLFNKLQEKKSTVKEIRLLCVPILNSLKTKWLGPNLVKELHGPSQNFVFGSGSGRARSEILIFFRAGPNRNSFLYIGPGREKSDPCRPLFTAVLKKSKMSNNKGTS